MPKKPKIGSEMRGCQTFFFFFFTNFLENAEATKKMIKFSLIKSSLKNTKTKNQNFGNIYIYIKSYH